MKNNYQLKDEDLSEMERDFKKVFDTYHLEIQEKINAAAQLLAEAESLSELHGIPFRPKVEIMFCNPSYIPESFREKFPGLESDFWVNITGAYGNDEWAGWQQSQTC